MAWRVYNNGATLVLLKIKIDVACFLETEFSDRNATDNDESHGPTFEDLRNINISATKERFLRSEDPLFKPHQAECMIKTFLPIEYIENINNPQRMF